MPCSCGASPKTPFTRRCFSVPWLLPCIHKSPKATSAYHRQHPNSKEKGSGAAQASRPWGEQQSCFLRVIRLPSRKSPRAPEDPCCLQGRLQPVPQFPHGEQH